jgi:general stress protein 26
MSAEQTLNHVLENHNLMHLATVMGTSAPCVRGVDFAAAGDGVVYFMTRRDSRKVKQIEANGAVAFAIDHDCPTAADLQQLKYIKGTGQASLVTDAEETQQAMGLLMKKFPFLAELPGDPSDFAAIKVQFHEVMVSDNTISFGHTETLNLG